jgi:hypothetical protein
MLVGAGDLAAGNRAYKGSQPAQLTLGSSGMRAISA